MTTLTSHLSAITHYWDTVAERYLELFRDELQSKPFDLEILRTFASNLGPGARVCDAGCGPCAHTTRLLADCGLDMTGVDISPRCIDLARLEQPAVSFITADIGAMPFEDNSFDGLLAYYALHYEPRATLSRILREFHRVLRPGARLLVVAKEGSEEGLIPDPLGSGQQVFWSAMSGDDLSAAIESDGFHIVASQLRAPLQGEIRVRRIYLSAQKR